MPRTECKVDAAMPGSVEFVGDEPWEILAQSARAEASSDQVTLLFRIAQHKTDKEMIQFVLDACKGELNLLGLEYKKARRTDEQINGDFLTEIAWLLGLAQGERECRQVSPR